MKTDSLIKGTLILALAAFVARFLGIVQRVPLKHLLDDAGMATYGIAYNMYGLLLVVATAGIPSALSKLVSERTALGRDLEAARIFRAALQFAFLAGLLFTALLLIGAPYYAAFSRDPDATLAIRALAPAMLLFPLIAMMRGYFQGRQMMTAGGMSQIVEQIARVATAVGFAYVLLRLGFSHQSAVAGASFGGVTGAVGAFLVMLWYWRKLRKHDRSVEADRRANNEVEAELAAASNVEPLRLRSIYRMIFTLSVPISLVSLAVPTIYFIDSSITIGLLENQTGYALAKDWLGILTGRAQSIAGIPPIMSIALSLSILPIVSSAFARGDHSEVADKASQSIRLAILSGLPLVLVLSIAASPLNGLLFGNTTGSGVIALLTVSSMFQIVMMTSGTVLMGLGRTQAPMRHVFIGIAVKLAGSYALAPYFGIYGIVTATALCFAVTMTLNLIVLRRHVGLNVLGRRWFGLSAAALATIAGGLGAYWAAGRLLSDAGPAFVRHFAHSALTALVTGVLYVVLLAVCRVVTRSDIDTFPAPLAKATRKALRFLRLG